MIEVRARLFLALCSVWLQSCIFWCTIATPFGSSHQGTHGEPLGEGEGEQMHWYNPKRRVAESVGAFRNDEEAEHMLRGGKGSWAFLVVPYGVREALPL